jgi:hypothetical protein
MLFIIIIIITITTTTIHTVNVCIMLIISKINNGYKILLQA